VRIERLDVEAFGRLTSLQGEDGPLPSLVVVLGPNEAGKSTVFEFLTTMLYGFSPASRDLNPFVPWGSDEARGALHMRLTDGRAATITRRLRSQPASQLDVEGTLSDLRNHPLPWVEHVPRKVFRQVFAITLGELASLDEDTWARIQDRVVGSMGASDLRPVREVAAELERETGELWRPNRRGKQKIRQARDELRALRVRRREAVQRDRDLRARMDDLQRARGVLKARRERRAMDQALLDRAQVLLPVRAQLHRIAQLEREAGPEALLQGLPREPLLRLEEDRARVRSLEEELREAQAERVAPRERKKALTSQLRIVLSQRDQIDRYVSGLARAVADRERAGDLQAELAILEERLNRICLDLVGLPWASAPRDRLLQRTPTSVRAAVERLERARSRVGTEEADRAPDVGTSPAGPSLAVIAGTLGLATAVWGVMSGRPALTALGMIAAAGSLALAWTLSRTRSTREAALAEWARRREEANRELREARAMFMDLFEDLELSERHGSYPDRALTDALERLHDSADQHSGKVRVLEEIEARQAATAREGQALVRSLAVEADAETDPEVFASVLSGRLREAEQAEQAAAAAERELSGLNRNIERIEVALAASRAAVADLEEAARRFAEDSVEDGLQEATRRLEALERARRLEEELEESQPDLPLLRQRIDEAEREGARWLSEDGDLVTRRGRVRQLQDQIEELERKTSALTKEVELARGEETADQVDGEAATLEATTAALVRARDRKWVLAHLLREADRAFREEHQPDLMRRAGRHLSHLTDGRYDRILVEETDERDLFRIAGPGIAGPIPLSHPVSTGTLEQAYLSLRLAIVDHLDQGTESLPLFIDEVFVNWDAERRRRGMEVVAGLAETRQVFVFTCHPFMARELTEAGARLVELGRE
jgi:uncharacterized protein YhaN